MTLGQSSRDRVGSPLAATCDIPSAKGACHVRISRGRIGSTPASGASLHPHRAACPRSRAASCSHSLALLALAALFSAPHAHATDGHLRITATAPGTLEFEHAAGWSRSTRIESGTQMIWCLPAGTYALRFTPDAGAAGAGATGEAIVWDDLTTRVEIDAQQKTIRSSAGDDDGRGAILLLPADLLDMLPDDPAASSRHSTPTRAGGPTSGSTGSR